jgi:hypothetical protein
MVDMSDLDTYARYDYAWQQAGWTAQNPGYVISGDTYHDPGLPADVSKVVLFGEFLDFVTGRPLEGVLTLRTSQRLTYIPTNTPVMPGVRKIRFNRGGFSLVLPATDDPQLTPEYLYQAKLTVAGHSVEFQFTLPAADVEVNINDLIPNPTGSLVIEDVEDSGVSLGSVPSTLTVNLVTGADFYSVLTNDDGWDAEDVITLKVGNLTWTATISGDNATFSVDKAVADTVADGTDASLVITNDDFDQVWAVGKVVRHGSST